MEIGDYDYEEDLSVLLDVIGEGDGKTLGYPTPGIKLDATTQPNSRKRG